MGGTSRSGGLLGWSWKVTLELRPDEEEPLGQCLGRGKRAKAQKQDKVSHVRDTERAVWTDGGKEGIWKEMQSEEARACTIL